MQIKKTYLILQFAKVLVGDSKKPTKPINQKSYLRPFASLRRYKLKLAGQLLVELRI